MSDKIRITIRINKEMYDKIKEKENNVSNYVRQLIIKDNLSDKSNNVIQNKEIAQNKQDKAFKFISERR